MLKPQANARVISSNRGARICSTNSWLKNSSCDPDVRNARAIPPMPIKAPPIPTHQKPLAASLAKNGPRKMTSPATPWKSGTEIFLSVSRSAMADMAIAIIPSRANQA